MQEGIDRSAMKIVVSNRAKLLIGYFGFLLKYYSQIFNSWRIHSILISYNNRRDYHIQFAVLGFNTRLIRLYYNEGKRSFEYRLYDDTGKEIKFITDIPMEQLMKSLDKELE